MWLQIIGTLLLTVTASASPAAEQHLVDWIVKLGGSVSGEIRVNSDGVRGLFATRDIPQHGSITDVPDETVINVGGSDFDTPILTLLRELHSGGTSRVQPYLDTLPSRGEVLNSCNFPPEYTPMLQSALWEGVTSGWEVAMQGILEGQLYEHNGLTLPEALGAGWRNITMDDLRHACALSTTRYVGVSPRTASLLVPIFDLMNHERKCQNHFVNIVEPDRRILRFVAGQDIQEGDELCSYYGDLRDDYAVVHYGFLPRLEDPPRLCLVDHPAHTADTYDEMAAQHGATSTDTDAFDGTPDELQRELERLQGILSALQALDVARPAPPRTVAGGDYAYDLLLGLQQRRRAALRYWIQNLSELLDQNIKDEYEADYDLKDEV